MNKTKVIISSVDCINGVVCGHLQYAQNGMGNNSILYIKKYQWCNEQYKGAAEASSKATIGRG